MSTPISLQAKSFYGPSSTCPAVRSPLAAINPQKRSMAVATASSGSSQKRGPSLLNDVISETPSKAMKTESGGSNKENNKAQTFTVGMRVQKDPGEPELMGLENFGESFCRI